MMIVLLLTLIGHHHQPVQSQDRSQNLLSVIREGGSRGPSHLWLGVLETIDLDHLSDLAITPAMNMIDGHIGTLGMTEVEDGIWADFMIVTLLSQGEIGVEVQVHDLENHFEMIHIPPNAVTKVHARQKNCRVLVLDLQIITGEVDHLREVMMRKRQITEGVLGQNRSSISIDPVIN